VPGAGNPQSLNRYTYVNNNPLAYTDPSGYDPLNAAWESDFRSVHGRMPTGRDRYLRLLSLILPGSGAQGAWTDTDWEAATYAYEGAMASPSRELSLLTNGMPKDALATFAGHLQTLANYYESGEHLLYVSAVAFLWAGMPYNPTIFVLSAMDVGVRNTWRKIPPLQQRRSVHLTPYPMLMEGSTGWDPVFVDDSNPSHHYAAFVYMGVMSFSLAKQLNFWRDADNTPDILVGDIAAAHGSRIYSQQGAFKGLWSWVLRDFR